MRCAARADIRWNPVTAPAPCVPCVTACWDPRITSGATRQTAHMTTDDPTPDPRRLRTADELALLAGCTVERIQAFTEAGILEPRPDGRYDVGDVHRIRLVHAFEANGVPFEAIRAATTGGRLDFGSYHELHPEPDAASERDYATFATSIDPGGSRLAELYTAMGLAEPHAGAHLTLTEEATLARLLERLDDLADRPLGIRAVRLFAEAARRTSEATLDIFQEAAERLGPDAASVDEAAYSELLRPWARLAQDLPELAGWLTERHLRRTIDGYSAESTERILAAFGYVAPRVQAPPGIAFVDLTGYTRTTQERGDEAAAALSLRLGEIARDVAASHGGRLVKLLGDGALLHLPDGTSAALAALELCDELRAAGLPGGHAGISAGPVIEREGDVYGRTVNLAARLSDLAEDGVVLAPASMADGLAAAGLRATHAGVEDLHGIGAVEVVRLERAT